MPKHQLLSREKKKRALGFKAAKDCLTLLLGGTANRDFGEIKTPAYLLFKNSKNNERDSKTIYTSNLGVQ